MSGKVKEFISQIKGRNIHVVGFSGTESSAIAFFLQKWGIEGFAMHDFSEEGTLKRHFRSANTALDAEELNERYEKLLSLPAKFHYKDSYLEGIEDADVIFVPQSWYLYECNEPLKKLQKTKEFMHITKLYFHLTDAMIIGVTGSNGKTTTSNLINHILKESGRSVYFSGNDRGTTQILEDIEQLKKDDILLLEISNRQLKIDLGKSPHIAVITNITPNHLKEYDSFKEYKKGKESILKYQTENDYAVLNYDDECSRDAIKMARKLFGFSSKKELERGAYLVADKLCVSDDSNDQDELLKVCEIEELGIKGSHNVSNALAALAACCLAGLNNEELRNVKTFKGVAQRQELVATIKDVEYYNDTSSTSPESVIAALEALKENVILIAGGRNKGLDSREMSSQIEAKVKELILIESPFAEEIRTQLSKEFLKDVHTVKTLKEAIVLAHEIAEAKDKVILSPGAEYFVYFKDKMPGYKNFRTFVLQLARKE